MTDEEFVRNLEELPPWDWPKNTATVLRRVLHTHDLHADVRAKAASFASFSVLIDDELSRALLEILCSEDENPIVRAAAAIAFGPALEQVDVEAVRAGDGFDDVPISEEMFERIRTTLRHLYETREVPKEVRRKTLEASVRSPEDWHPDAIRSAYSSGDPDWKLTAVFCMRYVEGFSSEILASLESSSQEIVYEAVHAAGEWEVAGAWPRVSELALDIDAAEDLRIAAIWAMPSLRPAECIELLEALIDDEDETIVEAASESIATAEMIVGIAEEDEEDEEDELDALDELFGDEGDDFFEKNGHS